MKRFLRISTLAAFCFLIVSIQDDSVTLAADAAGSADTGKQAHGFHDRFTDPDFESRQALRGDWKFVDGTARCVADPELYKKYDNHGPILRWPAKFTDGTLEFEFRPQDCQRVIITLNEKGHVFRMLFHEPDRTRFFGWIGKSSKTNKPKTNKPKTVAKEGVPAIGDLDRQWIKARIVFAGDTADISYGDFHTKVTHPSIGRPKEEFTISFASGELQVRDVRLSLSKQ